MVCLRRGVVLMDGEEDEDAGVYGAGYCSVDGYGRLFYTLENYSQD